LCGLIIPGFKTRNSILSNFFPRSKPLRVFAGRNPYLLVILLLFSSPWGCFYRVTLEPPVSLKIDPKEYQPVALLPLHAAPAPTDPGAELYPFLRDSLEKKGYTLVKEAEVSEALEEMKLNPLLLLSDRDSRIKVGERLKAGLLMIGTLPEYRVQKSHLGSQSIEAFDGESFSALLLPTYFRGSSQVHLILRIFESKKGDLVWAAEGTIKASSDSAGPYSQKLADRLLQSLPPVSPPSAK
jgi:hypothetical protein